MDNRHANLDLGRAITCDDIIDPNTFPFEERSEVFCYTCMERSSGLLADLQPLTSSTGVFTSLVRCEFEAPVYLCLCCLPTSRGDFGVFTPQVAATLNEKRKALRPF